MADPDVAAPLLLINFKAYGSSIGRNAERLAEQILLAKAETKTQVTVAVAVQPTDIFRLKRFKLPILSQHADLVSFGAHTGHILPESLKESGAVGSLLNHSECQIPLVRIESTVKRLRSIGIQSVVCANTPSIAENVAKFEPDFIAIEPPELIGGDVSVSKANPEIVTNTIKKVHSVHGSIPVLCGAGVKDHEDVRIAIKLGAEGILVASGVTKAKDPKGAVIDLLSGFE
jgi:triosephosphate isomerase